MGIGVSFLKNLVLVTIYLLNVYGYILYVRVSNVSVGFVLVFFPSLRCVLALHQVFGCVVLT